MTTDEPTRVTLEVADGSRNWMRTFEDVNTGHTLPVLGFRPNKTHTIRVTVVDTASNRTTAETALVVTTPPLPPGFPPIVVESEPDRMEPGVTLFDVIPRGANEEFGPALVAVDETGEVVWYHRDEHVFGDVRQLSNGNLLLMQPNQGRIVEMDMLGNVVRAWATTGGPSASQDDAILVDADAFHHEVFEMANGHFLVLAIEYRTLDDYPTSDRAPRAPTATTRIAGDVVVEYTSDGTVVNRWSMFDLIDPYRIGYGVFNEFWGEETVDWTHGNAVIHDARDDSIIVCLRQQDAIIKFSRRTGELIWILGPHENWDPERFGHLLLTPNLTRPFRSSYQPHAPMVTPQRTLLLFDNGNNRASPFDERLPPADNFSRAVEYAIDESTMDVTQVWEYGESTDERLFAPFLGDADMLPVTGNVLITYGGVRDRQNRLVARLIEVTHSTPAAKIFDLAIVDQTSDRRNGWSIYRSERLPGLYR